MIKRMIGKVVEVFFRRGNFYGFGRIGDVFVECF